MRDSVKTAFTEFEEDLKRDFRACLKPMLAPQDLVDDPHDEFDLALALLERAEPKPIPTVPTQALPISAFVVCGCLAAGVMALVLGLAELR
jgi:hypothetical protein